VFGSLSLRGGSEICRVFLIAGGNFAGAWVPIGAGPYANAPLAPSGPRGSIFAGGLWEPRGVLVE
jgi:hypothetical protein